MDVLDAIYGMRATRIYHDKPIPEFELTRILQAATRACSAGNTQPWEFVVVTDHAAIENMDVVAAIVLAFWTPDRGIRLKDEYEENADGTMTRKGGFENGRGSSIYPAC